MLARLYRNARVMTVVLVVLVSSLNHTRIIYFTYPGADNRSRDSGEEKATGETPPQQNHQRDQMQHPASGKPPQLRIARRPPLQSSPTFQTGLFCPFYKMTNQGKGLIHASP
jgi:hypothetical protein